ncbi:MAG: hypothetical protein JOZ87_28240 [Chloroflexi bacterium]|nr:hypothetical protein [Chloroflexota bacterium]
MEIWSKDAIERGWKARPEWTTTRRADVYGRQLDVTITRHFGEIARVKNPYGELASRPYFQDAHAGGLRLRDGVGPMAFPRDLPGPAVGELLTVPSNLGDFITKSVVDIDVGAMTEPLVYPPLYRRLVDPNFSNPVDLDTLPVEASVIFLDHIEGEEVQFGTRQLGEREAVPITTWTAGFEYTQDMVEYDRTWQIQQLNEAFGRAHNALLNHIHLFPIISFPYPPENVTPAYVDPSGDYRLSLRGTISRAWRAAANQDRPPNAILAPSSLQFDLADALGPLTVNGTTFPSVGGSLRRVVYYDTTYLRRGNRTFRYPGVPEDTLFLVQTSDYLTELVKHDLRIQAGPGDLTRLIAQQLVGVSRRGVYCVPQLCVQKVEIPPQP